MVLPKLLLLIFITASIFLLSSKLQSLNSPKAEADNIIQNFDVSDKRTLYNDLDIKFSFKYPSDDLTIVFDSEEEMFKRDNADYRKNFTDYVGFAPPKLIKAVVVKTVGEKLRDEFNQSPFTIWIFENNQQLSTEKWYDSFWYYPFIWGMFSDPQKDQVAPKNEATISGRITRYAEVPYSPGSPKFYYLSDGEKMFLFRVIDNKFYKGSEILASFTI